MINKSSKQFFVYILASKRNGTLYTGVTNHLARRTLEHKQGKGSVFTKRYGVRLLIYYEAHVSISEAIQRESNIKHWPRRWKLDLIEAENPEWRDLFGDIDA